MYRYRYLKSASLIAAMIAVFGAPAIAGPESQKGEPEQKTHETERSQQSGEKSKSASSPAELQARINEVVLTHEGEEIGTFEQLVVQKGTNQTHAVVSVERFMGLSSKEVAVPIDQLSFDESGVILMSQGMPADKALESMPEYDEEKFEEYGSDSKQKKNK